MCAAVKRADSEARTCWTASRTGSAQLAAPTRDSPLLYYIISY